MVEDYIMPLAFIDGKSIAKVKDKNVKAKSYEASLNRVVDELNSFVLESVEATGKVSLTPRTPERVRDVSQELSGGDPVYVDAYVYLMCAVCDLKETTGVANHTQPVGYCVCHRCNEKGAVLNTPAGTGGQGSHTILHPTTNGDGGIDHKEWTDATARQEAQQAEYAKAMGLRPRGWLGESPLCRLKYFDMTRSILVCAMHQFSNVVIKCLSLMLGEDGWTGTQLAAFLADDEGALGNWGMTGAEWKRKSGLPFPEDLPDESQDDMISDKMKELDKSLGKPEVKDRLDAANVPYGKELKKALLRKLALFELGMDQEEVLEPAPDGDAGGEVGAEDELGGVDVLEGVRTHNVFSKKVKNGFMAAGPWPKGLKPLKPHDRDLRMGLEWSKKVLFTHARMHAHINTL